MRVDVMKPIQSLHAFGRHCRGGGIAALPLHLPCSIRMKTAVFAMITIIMSVVSSNGQTPDEAPVAKERQIDHLFDRIMESLPDAARMKVDSAGSSAERRPAQSSDAAKLSGIRKQESVEQQLRRQELPDDLKAQVERAIDEMELKKEHRKMQFRESRRDK